MCGVIGYVPSEGPMPDAGELFHTFWRLFSESRVRGMHAYGIARPGFVFRSHDFDEVWKHFDPRFPTIAHCRYSTSGDWQTMNNNQPIVVGDLALAFNGVIHMGTKEELERDFGIDLVTDNDGEAFLRRIVDDGDTSAETFHHFIVRMDGSFAGVWLDGDKLYAGRNERRPLWSSVVSGAVWYASTKDIFTRAGFAPCQVSEMPVGVFCEQD